MATGTELHRSATTRRNQARLEALLHPDFEEFGRFGRRYSRDEVLREFVTQEELARVHARTSNLGRLMDANLPVCTCRPGRQSVSRHPSVVVVGSNGEWLENTVSSGYAYGRV